MTNVFLYDILLSGGDDMWIYYLVSVMVSFLTTYLVSKLLKEVPKDRWLYKLHTRKRLTSTVIFIPILNVLYIWLASITFAGILLGGEIDARKT